MEKYSNIKACTICLKMRKTGGWVGVRTPLPASREDLDPPLTSTQLGQGEWSGYPRPKASHRSLVGVRQSVSSPDGPCAAAGVGSCEWDMYQIIGNSG